jgi:hypothetical protein
MRNDAQQSASEAISQNDKSSVAHNWGQVFMFEGKSYPLGRAFTNEFTIIEHNEPLQKRTLKRLMVVLLMIEGNLPRLRARLTHLVGHLPLD